MYLILVREAKTTPKLSVVLKSAPPLQKHLSVVLKPPIALPGVSAELSVVLTIKALSARLKHISLCSCPWC